MNKSTSMPPSSSHSDSGASCKTPFTKVRVFAKWLGSNVAVVDHDLLLVIKSHASVLSKSKALQNLIADAIGKADLSHNAVRVVWEIGNVELSPNPATGYHCPGNGNVKAVPWTPPPATARAWELICAAGHTAENTAENTNQLHQQHDKLTNMKRVKVLVSRYSNQDLLTGGMYWDVEDYCHGAITREVGRMVNITELNLRDLELSGPIPTEFGRITNMRKLVLRDNELTGSLPTEFGKLVNLEVLRLGSNKLTGSIPTELGKLTNMHCFNLYDNILSGSIPTELGECINVNYLSLAFNKLTGSIPTEFGKLVNMTHLLLYVNHLKGSVPTELSKLVNMKDLDLSHNHLDDLMEFKLYMKQKVPTCRFEARKGL